MRILFTGFDPFGGEKINPAGEAVKMMKNEIQGAEILKLEVPTVFGKAGEVLKKSGGAIQTRRGGVRRSSRRESRHYSRDDSREHNGRAHSRQRRKQAVPRAYNKRGKRSVFFLTSGEGYREKSK